MHIFAQVAPLEDTLQNVEVRTKIEKARDTEEQRFGARQGGGYSGGFPTPRHNCSGFNYNGGNGGNQGAVVRLASDGGNPPR